MLIGIAGNILTGLVSLGIVLKLQDHRLRRVPGPARDTRPGGPVAITAKGPRPP